MSAKGIQAWLDRWSLFLAVHFFGGWLMLSNGGQTPWQDSVGWFLLGWSYTLLPKGGSHASR